MNVSNVLYVSEQWWGVGPGGNETGLVVFQLPASIAAQLKAHGIDYLERLPQNTRDGWQEKYANWRETPLMMNQGWGSTSYEGRRYWASPGIGDYLNKYGYPVSFEKSWEEMVNSALFATGSYYAYGRNGLIVIVPDELRVIFACNG